MLANSFCAVLSFGSLVLVGFFLLHLEAVFRSACFSLIANVSHGTLGLDLCLNIISIRMFGTIIIVIHLCLEKLLEALLTWDDDITILVCHLNPLEFKMNDH